jgi:hypothetical protein
MLLAGNKPPVLEPDDRMASRPVMDGRTAP